MNPYLFIWWMFWSVATGLMIARSVCSLLSLKQSWWARMVLLLCCWLIANMVILFGDWDNLPPTILAFLAGICLVCGGSRQKKLTVGLMFASAIFSFNAISDNFLRGSCPRIEYSVFFRFFFALCLMAGTRYFAPDKDYELSPEMWRLLGLLTATPVCVVLATVLMGGRENLPAYLVLMVISLFSFIGLLWTVTVLAKQRKLEQQNMYGKINEAYYQSMEQQQFEIRRMRHDLANHLQVLSTLPQARRDAYLQELLHSEALNRSLVYCGDSTINAVLTVKEHQMAQKQIRLEKKLDIPQELPFNPSDVCALFANALDNAMEACQTLPEEQRLVELEGRAAKGLLAVSVKNPSNLVVRPGTLPPTSKKDRKNHGLGLKGMEEIVKRYGGDMEVKSENGCFILFLYLPVI